MGFVWKMAQRRGEKIPAGAGQEFKFLLVWASKYQGLC